MSTARAGASGTVRLLPPLLATYLIFGAGYVAAKIAVEGGLPPLMLGARFAAVGVLLVALRVAMGRSEGLGERAAWGGAAASGLGMLLGGQGLAVIAIQDLPAGTVAVLMASTPLFAAVIGHVAGFARVTGMGFAAIGLGVAGVGVLSSTALGGGGGAVPVLLVIGAALAWALGSTVGERMHQAPDRMTASGMQMIVGGGALAVASVVAGEPARFDPGAVTAAGWWAFAFMAGAVSFVGFPLFVRLTETAPPAVANSFAYVAPAVSAALAFLLLGERFGGLEVAGCALILASVVLLLRFGHRSRREKPTVRTRVFARSATRGTQ